MTKQSDTLKNEQWFKFYYLRILGSCKGWKDDEFGAYVKLLIHQFDKGFIPDDEKEIKRIITTYKKNWPLLKKKFPEVEPGILINDVMKIVRAEYDQKKANGKEHGPKGGRPKKETQIKPKGFQNERDIYSSSYSDSGCLEKEEGSGEEKTVELSPDGFFLDMIDKKIELTDLQIGKTIEYVRIKTKILLTAQEVKEQWEAFKINKFSKHEWKNNFEDVVSHFRDSLKLEKHKNGTQAINGNPKQRVNKSSGAVGLKNDLEADLATGP